MSELLMDTPPQSYEPTMRLRWFECYRPHPDFSEEVRVKVKVLQQLWLGSAGDTKWEDVETEYET